MAFETFLTNDKSKPKKGRRLTYALSLGVHGILLALGVAGSYAGVDELKPPSPIVTFFHSPPPAPLGGGERQKTKRRPTPPKVKFPSKIVPPQLDRTVKTDESSPGIKDAPPGDGRPDGNEGGNGTHIDDGDDPSPKFLPPNVARGRLAIDPQADQHRVKLPAAIRSSGMAVSALMRICADRDGRVTDVKILRIDDPSLEANFVSAVGTWRYTPYQLDGRPIPFCTNVRYEIRTTN